MGWLRKKPQEDPSDRAQETIQVAGIPVTVSLHNPSANPNIGSVRVVIPLDAKNFPDGKLDRKAQSFKRADYILQSYMKTLHGCEYSSGESQTPPYISVLAQLKDSTKKSDDVPTMLKARKEEYQQFYDKTKATISTLASKIPTTEELDKLIQLSETKAVRGNEQLELTTLAKQADAVLKHVTPWLKANTSLTPEQLADMRGHVIDQLSEEKAKATKPRS